ncbi:FixJ family two-component response regulator [Paraburkholderia youngii]
MSSGSGLTSTKGASDGPPSMVYVIDDDEAVRIALNALLRSAGLHVETFSACREFLAFPKKAVPSCLILDVRLQGETGLAFQKEFAKSEIRMPIVFMTGYADVAMSVRAMKAGAFDFLAKPFRDQEILDAVTDALARDGERVQAEQALVALRAAYASLTIREQEVVRYVIAGLMNKQIAAQMKLSEVTVKIHRGHAMRKLAAHSVPDLVRKAEALGLKPQVDGPS